MFTQRSNCCLIFTCTTDSFEISYTVIESGTAFEIIQKSEVWDIMSCEVQCSETRYSAFAQNNCLLHTGHIDVHPSKVFKRVIVSFAVEMLTHSSH